MYYNIYETPEGRRFRGRVPCATREMADRLGAPIPGERCRRVAVIDGSRHGFLQSLFLKWPRWRRR
jgi:hypothetical protein